MNKDARGWLEAAREDLDTAEYNLEGDRLRFAAFLSQQAAKRR